MRTGPGMTFRFGATSVRIEWSFLAIIVAFGLYLGHGPGSLVTWLAIVVVGVLVHEGGHVAALAACGRRSRVRLAWLSGMTISEDQSELTPARSVGVSLAGPAAGFTLGLIVELALSGQRTGLLGAIREQSFFVNIVWSAFNLLPVIPLDGGHVARELFEFAGRRRATTIVAIVGVSANLIAGVIAVASDLDRGWALLVLSMLLATNVVFLPITPKQQMRFDVERVHSQLMTGDLSGGIARMQAHLMSPHAALVGPGPRTTLAWALLHEGRLEDLSRVDLILIHPDHRTLLGAAVAWYRGDLASATSMVTQALATGPIDPPSTYFQRTFGRLGEVDQLSMRIDQLPREQIGPARLRLHSALVASRGTPSRA